MGKVVCIYTILYTDRSGIVKRFRLKSEMLNYRVDLGIIKKESCSKEETEKLNKIIADKKILPQGIYQNAKTGTFTQVMESELNEEEMREFIQLKQTRFLKVIKNGVAILAVIAIVNTFILLYMYTQLLKI